MIPVPTVQTQRVPLHVPVILGTVGMETPVKVNCLIYTYRMFYDQKKKKILKHGHILTLYQRTISWNGPNSNHLQTTNQMLVQLLYLVLIV